MKIDLLFDPFGVTWLDVRDGARAAEGEGFDGVWLYDHLAGSVHGQSRVLDFLVASKVISPLHFRTHAEESVLALLRDSESRSADRLLTPLLAADTPPAPLPLRRALHAIDEHVDSYIHHARL